MKRFPFFVGLLSVFALYLIGCPAASIQPATLAPESAAASTTTPPTTELPVDPFVPRSPLDDLQVAESRDHRSRLVEKNPETAPEAPQSIVEPVKVEPEAPKPVDEPPKANWDALPTEQETKKSTPKAEPKSPEPGSRLVEEESKTDEVAPPNQQLPLVEEKPKPVDEPKSQESGSRLIEEESTWAPATPSSFADLPATSLSAETLPAQTTPSSSFAETPATAVPAAETTPSLSFAEPVEKTPKSDAESREHSSRLAEETPKSDAEIREHSSRLEEETPKKTPKPDAEIREHSSRLPNPQSPIPNSQLYDPIKINGEYFVDWPKPKLLLVFTGFMNGYVEPCGCAGIEQMKGGLSRRRTFLQELDKKDWPVIPVDAGNLNKGFGLQEELKYNIVIDESFRQMKYNIVGLGNRELLFPTDVLILYCVDVPGSPRRYTSANVRLLDDPDCMASFRTETKNGVKIGVISVIGESAFGEVNNQDVKRLDIVERMKEVLPKFDAENCNQRVLIVHGSNAEFQSVLKAFPNRFEFALCSDGPAEPPAEPQWINNTMNVEVGEKGKYAVAVGLFDDVDHPMRYQRVALDSRFKNAPDVMLAMKFYQDQLKASGLKGLGIKAIPNRRAAENGTYVGSKACADCHEPSMKIWKKSGHAHAWKSLVETSKPARNFDPECIACHVVGWSPAEFLPYENGFLGEKETPLLTDVGCESCHGPGEMHVAAEKGADDLLKQKLRKAVRLPVEGNAARKHCIECHDGDNSPHFDFDTYWPKIKHDESAE